MAPFIRVPSPMADLRVERMGDEVLVGFTLPTQNQDGTQPADLERVDIYAMTVQPHIPADRRLDLEEFQEEATLVTSIEAGPPLAPVAETEATGEAPVDPRPPQGFPVAFSEAITAALLAPVDPWEEEREAILRAKFSAMRRRERDDKKNSDELKTPAKVPLMTPLLPGPLERRYAVVGVSSRGHESEAPTRIAVPLITPPFPPPPPMVTYDAEVVTVAWEPPVGVRLSVQSRTVPGAGLAGASAVAPIPGTAAPAATPADPTAPASDPATVTGTPSPPAAGTAPAAATTGLPPTPAIPLPPPLTSTTIVDWPPASRYELFEVVAPGDEVVDPGDAALVLPRSLNLTPLAVTTYADKRVEFGVERCYAVLTLDVVSGLEIRSPLSTPTCVTLLDTFAPVAPRGLTAVGSEGAVSLSWDPSEEEDWDGYLVLRGLASGETLLPLAEPVRESTYRDETAEPGVRYSYAVQAVDNAVPLNISPASETVSAVAR